MVVNQSMTSVIGLQIMKRWAKGVALSTEELDNLKNKLQQLENGRIYELTRA